MSLTVTELDVETGFNANIAAAGYLNFESTLADNQAINIDASNPVGGIDINAGSGGIDISTTNAINMTANAQSGLTTTTGNIVFDSAGVFEASGDGGMNLGNDANTNSINVATVAQQKTVNIGNLNTATGVNVASGTGGINLDSTGAISLDASGASSNFTLNTTGNGQDLTIALNGASTDSSLILTSTGTGNDAIKMDTTGGIDVDASGPINFASGDVSGGAITLDTAFGGGGITISSGSFGIGINGNGGTIGIGHFSGGELLYGTAAVARNITIGNITGATRTIQRTGTGGFYRSQLNPTSLTDADQTLTLSQLESEILTGTPTVDRTLTLPDASTIVSSVPGIQFNDAIDFYIINNSLASDIKWILAMGTGGTLDGNPSVSPRENTVSTYKNSGSSKFRLRITNTTPSSESYTVYRLC
jgi:hypothetical protein